MAPAGPYPSLLHDALLAELPELLPGVAQKAHEHSFGVLVGLLGYSREKFRELREQGVVK